MVAKVQRNRGSAAVQWAEEIEAPVAPVVRPALRVVESPVIARDAISNVGGAPLATSLDVHQLYAPGGYTGTRPPPGARSVTGGDKARLEKQSSALLKQIAERESKLDLYFNRMRVAARSEVLKQYAEKSEQLTPDQRDALEGALSCVDTAKVCSLAAKGKAVPRSEPVERKALADEIRTVRRCNCQAISRGDGARRPHVRAEARPASRRPRSSSTPDNEQTPLAELLCAEFQTEFMLETLFTPSRPCSKRRPRGRIKPRRRHRRATVGTEAAVLKRVLAKAAAAHLALERQLAAAHSSVNRSAQR